MRRSVHGTVQRACARVRARVALQAGEAVLCACRGRRSPAPRGPNTEGAALGSYPAADRPLGHRRAARHPRPRPSRPRPLPRPPLQPAAAPSAAPQLKYGNVSLLPTHAFLHSLELGETTQFIDNLGKECEVKMLGARTTPPCCAHSAADMRAARMRAQP